MYVKKEGRYGKVAFNRHLFSFVPKARCEFVIFGLTFSLHPQLVRDLRLHCIVMQSRSTFLSIYRTHNKTRTLFIKKKFKFKFILL